MNDAWDSWDIRGLTVSLHQDLHAGDPFEEFDQLSELLQDGSPQGLPSPAHEARYLRLFGDCLVAIPYRIDCYGSSGSLGYLLDEDDAGPATGYLVVTRAAAQAEGMNAEQAEACARAEWSEYAAFLSGDVCGYTVTDEGGELLDSCWGFYGEKWARESADEAANGLADGLAEDRATLAAHYLTAAG